MEASEKGEGDLTGRVGFLDGEKSGGGVSELVNPGVCKDTKEEFLVVEVESTEDEEKIDENLLVNLENLFVIENEEGNEDDDEGGFCFFEEGKDVVINGF
jgi:hypothetical protein